MKVKSGLKLREVGNMYMIVEADSRSVNLTNVYNLNATAADIWKYAADIWKYAAASDFTLAQLATYVREEYDIDYDSALNDVTALVEEWIEAGIVLND